VNGRQSNGRCDEINVVDTLETMVRYQGGKHRIGRDIAAVIKKIEKGMGLENTPYYEPMVGAGGIFKWMANDDEASSSSRSDSRSRRRRNRRRRPRFASDANRDLISMWNALKKGWQPMENVSEAEWNRLKHSKGPTPERGFCGPFLSFGGQTWSGYANKYDDKTNYAKQAAKSINSFRDRMKDATYWGGSYLDIPHEPRGMIIVADPPYAQSKVAKPNKDFAQFDHDTFWRTMERWGKHNLVFVCEEVAPDNGNWVVVWQKPYRRGAANQRKNTRQYTERGEKAPVKMSVEKLFLYKTPPKRSVFDRPKFPF